MISAEEIEYRKAHPEIDWAWVEQQAAAAPPFSDATVGRIRTIMDCWPVPLPDGRDLP